MSDFKGDNIIDVRNICERVEELRYEIEEECEDELVIEYKKELDELEAVLLEIKGYGGDVNWEGYGYPGQLIHRSYFVEYTKLYCADNDMAVDEKRWPFNCIDWEAAADEFEDDFSTVDFDGEEYLYRG